MVHERPLEPIPVLSDNYAWLLVLPDQSAAVVDPGDAAPVLSVLASRELRLRAVLLTHHHGDHIGGVARLVASSPTPLTVYGPERERISDVTLPVGSGMTIELGPVHLEVIEVPGHTIGHVAYAGSVAGTPVMLTGDCLFAAGCGRIFEGTHAQMYQSLSRLAALPPSSQVCCGHEYTAANLRFAMAVEPTSQALAERADRVERLRSEALPSVPSELAEELLTNPFLRCQEPAVVEAACGHAGRAIAPGAPAFEVLRRWKDGFR